MNNKNNIIPNITCFKAHKQHNVCCNKTCCKNWINSQTILNCCIIAVENGPCSLEEIGNFFNLTRMRICQIEKSAKTKIAKTILE